MLKLKDVLAVTTDCITLEIEFIYCDTEIISGMANDDRIKGYENGIVTNIEADDNGVVYHVLMIPADTEAERMEIYNEWKTDNEWL